MMTIPSEDSLCMALPLLKYFRTYTISSPLYCHPFHIFHVPLTELHKKWPDPEFCVGLSKIDASKAAISMQGLQNLSFQAVSASKSECEEEEQCPSTDQAGRESSSTSVGASSVKNDNEAGDLLTGRLVIKT